jgi:hypothetical protein
MRVGLTIRRYLRRRVGRKSDIPTGEGWRWRIEIETHVCLHAEKTRLLSNIVLGPEVMVVAVILQWLLARLHRRSYFGSSNSQAVSRDVLDAVVGSVRRPIFVMARLVSAVCRDIL